MVIEKVLAELIQKGVDIEQIEVDKFIVVDNGFFNFCDDEEPFIVDNNEVLEIYKKYIK